MEGRPGSGQIGILGPVELTGEEPVPLGGARERYLLAALAVHCGQAVSAASLVDALWADDPPRTATKTLQNYVLHVRRGQRTLLRHQVGATRMKDERDRNSRKQGWRSPSGCRRLACPGRLAVLTSRVL